MGRLVRSGEYEIDLSLFQIRRRGKIVPVERRVFDLIAYLLANHGRVVSRKELVDHVWEGRSVSAGSLTVAISAARRALGDDSANPQVIITHRGRGYRFCDAGEHPQEGDSGSRAPNGFIGRAEQLSTLRVLLSAAASGRLSFATIVGEAGIGKSRLLERFGSIAVDMGATVALGRCREEDGAPPFWPWIQIARTLCARPENQESARQLVADAPELVRLTPRPVSSGASPESTLPPANARFRLFDGFARFVADVAARRTTVLLIDDIHRADHDSLLLLAFIVDSLRSSNVMVAASYRLGDLRRDLGRFDSVYESLRTGSGVVIELHGLDPGEITQFIRAVANWSPKADEVRILAELTGGNPFFLTQLAHLHCKEGVESNQIVGALPPTLRDAVLEQLRGISTRCMRILEVACVVGREFGSGLIACAAGMAPVEVARGLQEAVDVGAVEPAIGTPGAFRFKHAVVREVLYMRLDPGERARLHLAIGETMLRGGSRSEVIAEVAMHFSEAAIVGDIDRAIEVCCEAAAHARRTVAYGEAVRCYQRALTVLEQNAPTNARRKCDLLLALGSDQVRSGDREGAKLTFERAAQLAELIEAPELLAEAALGVAPGFFAVEAGVLDELLVSLLRRSLTLLRSDQHGLQALVRSRLGMALFWSDDGKEALNLSADAWRSVEGCADPVLRLQVLMGRWLAEWDPYALDRRRWIAAEALKVARMGKNRELLVMALLYGLVVALERGDTGQFDLLAAEFRDLASRLRQPQALWYAKLIESTRDLHAGRFAQAEENARAFHKLGRAIGDANAIHSRMAQGLIHASERGDGAGILEISDEGIQRYPVFFGWRASRCWGLARSGRIADAERWLEELLETGIKAVPRKLDWPTALVLLAETAFLLRKPSLAEEVLELLLPLQGSEVVLGFCVMSWGPVARYLGLVNEVLGRLDAARTWYEQAVEETRKSRSKPWEAHALFGLARVESLLGGDRPLVRELKSSVADSARRLGMRHLARQLADWKATAKVN